MAVGVGGFLAALIFLVGYYRQSLLMGIVSAMLASSLPLLSVFGFLYVVRVPWHGAPFWAFLPAGIIGEAIFLLAKKWSMVRM